ncbi:MAG: RNA polymerase sigma factor [Elusimicrobiota bacterium]
MDCGESFAELVRAHRARAYGYAFRLCGNEPDAADLVQDAFMNAYKNFDSFDEDRPFLPWFFRIVHNLFINNAKRTSRRREVSLTGSGTDADETAPSAVVLPPDNESDPLSNLVRLEDEKRIQKALDDLPDHYRGAVLLCDMERLDYADIGRILDCPVGTVKSRIHQGRKLLRALLRERQPAGGGYA